jgi:hypothetical protein
VVKSVHELTVWINKEGVDHGGPLQPISASLDAYG